MTSPHRTLRALLTLRRADEGARLVELAAAIRARAGTEAALARAAAAERRTRQALVEARLHAVATLGDARVRRDAAVSAEESARVAVATARAAREAMERALARREADDRRAAARREERAADDRPGVKLT